MGRLVRRSPRSLRSLVPRAELLTTMLANLALSWAVLETLRAILRRTAAILVRLGAYLARLLGGVLGRPGAT